MTVGCPNGGAQWILESEAQEEIWVREIWEPHPVVEITRLCEVGQQARPFENDTVRLMQATLSP